MNRRTFIKTVITGLAAGAISPALVLKEFVPVSKAIISGNTATANTLLSPSIIAKEAMQMLEKNLVMEALLDQKYYEGETWGKDIIKIRRPIKFEINKISRVKK